MFNAFFHDFWVKGTYRITKLSNAMLIQLCELIVKGTYRITKLSNKKSSVP